MARLLIVLDDERPQVYRLVVDELQSEGLSFVYAQDVEDLTDAFENLDATAVIIRESVLALQYKQIEFDFLRRNPVSRISVIPGNKIQRHTRKALVRTFQRTEDFRGNQYAE